MLSAGLTLFSGVNLAQETKTYKGPYGTGFAEYSYTENDKTQRVFDGRFTYSDTLEIEDRGECSLQMSGAYREDNKVTPWVTTIKGMSSESNETVTGPYLNGQKLGLWTHRITLEDVDILTATASFNRNKFKGTFSYDYAPTVDVDPLYKKLNVQGAFDGDGYLDGEWKFQYTNKQDAQIEEVARYQHGVLAFKVVRDVNTGKEIERYDKEAMVTAFFKDIQFPDSNAVVANVKYGILKQTNNHPILVPLMKAWNETSTVNLNNKSNASIPTMIIPRGEYSEPKYLVNMQEIVLWMDTPKGHKEWLEEQRIKEAYNAEVKKADEALAEKKFEDALAHYNAAHEIKSNEAHPISQIPKVEEMIRLRDTKNALLASVKEKNSLLASEQARMLAVEEFEKKQKHLHEAYVMAYDASFKRVNGNHSKVITNLERSETDITFIESISILELELYESDLKELIALQAKVSGLIGQDTKELEKELKKLDSAKLIETRLMR